MIINSTFRDYYDPIAHQHWDAALVYNRTTKELNLRKPEVYLEIPYTHWSPYAFRMLINPKAQIEREGYLKPAQVLLFCGKPYLIMGWEKTDRGGQEVIELSRLISNSSREIIEFARFNTGWCKKNQTVIAFKDNLTRFLGREYHVLHAKYKSPVLIEKYCASMRTTTTLIINPCLKTIDFQRIKDPYSAFQEIAMYLGGVMGSSGRPMVKPADKYRIAAAGHDPKTSFRRDTPPTRKQK
jgi:hypothetical protein